VAASPSYAPLCTAGYVYGILGTGQIRQVAPDGAVTNFGSVARPDGAFNGLGIGPGGASVLAYNRSNSSQTATIWKYDTSTNAWASTGYSVNSTTSNRTVTFVAGAVNLQNGRYLIGGFNADGSLFRIWEYNPAAPAAPTYKGHINTSSGAGGAANGDMAFDAAGNLFVVRGSGNTATVLSITAADLAAANGSSTPIPSSRSASVTTMSNVNGVAFDSTGKAFLGASDELRSYNMPNWSNSTTITTSLDGSTDLATCSSPPTVTIEKYVEGGRVSTTDQFTLTLKQGGQELGTATTTGPAPGLQAERIGPQPTVRGVVLTFSETGAGTTNLSNYVSSWRCLVDGQPTTSGNGTSGSITIPTTGQAVECRIYNAPLIANVTIHKDVTDFSGANPTPKQGWTVGAATTATTGTATPTPTATTQVTDASGNAGWSIKFGASADRATVNVSEVMQSGFGFSSGLCVVTKLDGNVVTTDLTGAAAQLLTGIAPGDQVQCGYVNSPQTGSITVTKADATNQAVLAGAVFQLWNDVNGDGILDPAVDTKVGPPQTTPASGVAAWTNLVWGKYLVQEVTPPAAYDLSVPAVRAFDVTQANRDLTSTFENPRMTGTVAWSKVAAGTTDLLGGSEWTIVGPGAPTPGTVILDCTQTPCGTGVFKDQDPVSGQFKLSGLGWGAYTITESKAPAGYVLDGASHEFQIGPEAEGVKLSWDLGRIENKQATPVVLPLTGGAASDVFLIGGGLLLIGAATAGVLVWSRRRRLHI
jgi:LPXTG-motif cell wall-anchored protein